MSGAGALQVLPGLAQAGAGMAQFGGEMITQLVNLLRQEQGAQDVSGAGQAAIQRIIDMVLPAAGDIGRRIERQRRYATRFDELGQTIRAGRNEALGRLDALPGRVATEGGRVTSGFQEALNRLRSESSGTLRRIRSSATRVAREARGDIERVASEGEGHIRALEGRVDSYVGDIRSRISEAVTGIRTNMTERVGSAVGGVRMEAARRAAEFEAEALASGRMNDDEIRREKNRMLEAADSEMSGLWNSAFTEMNSQIASTRVAGFQTLGNLYESTSAIASNLRANVLNDVADTIANANRVALYSLNITSEAEMNALALNYNAEQFMGNLNLGVFNALTGTMEFIADRASNIIVGEAGAQAELGMARINLEQGIDNALVAHDQFITGLYQSIVDLGLNTDLQAVGTRLGFMFQFPNLVGLMAPGMQMLQNAGSNMMSSGGGGQKGGFSVSILGTGGGASCIYCQEVVQTSGGLVRISQVVPGDHVLCPDGRYHLVLATDIGYVPVQHRIQYLLIKFKDGRHITLTKDHPVVASEDEIESVEEVPHCDGCDLLLDGSDFYMVNGVVVKSNISALPHSARNSIVLASKVRQFNLVGVLQ